MFGTLKRPMDGASLPNVMVKSPPPQMHVGLCGGMAERLKAHVLKTCLGHTNVGSNPTPSAIQPVVTTKVVHTKATEVATTRQAWGGARVVEWGRLLSGYRGEILGRRFESCPPRHTKRVPVEGRVFVLVVRSQSLQTLALEFQRLESLTPGLFKAQLHSQV